MPLTAGTRHGPYEIVSLLGSGGMGEVYRARDPKLNRDIALKILPDAVARDAERLARFEREAHVLAALNHPNIASIHQFEESAGVAALVMELIEGESLADRIARGRLPVDDALDIAKQIVDALDAAHERGIVHRDLKPSNIAITPEGRVKVLDFGLAKATPIVAAGISGDTADPTLSPTVIGPTLDGVLLGTAAYMSPEQARGRTVDKRADIWAFGCVLYEMLTGRRTFVGDSMTDVLAAVVAGVPDWQALPARTPAPIRRLLRRCLEKDIRRRLPQIGAARLEIEEALERADDPDLLNDGARGWRKAFAWVLAGTAIGLVGAAVLNRESETPAPSVSRFVIPLAAEQVLPFSERGALSFAISPDGQTLAYVAVSRRMGDQPKLYIRRLDGFESRQIAASDGAEGPFFSPDNEWVAFFSNGWLRKVSVASGPVLSIVRAQTYGYGAAWSDDDRIVYADAPSGILRATSPDGTRVESLTERSNSEIRHAYPGFTADGKHLIFSVMGEQPHVAVMTLATKERRVLLPGHEWGRVLSTGHLLFVKGEDLFGVPYDAEKREVTGSAAAVLEGVSNLRSAAAISLSKTGTLVFRTGLRRMPLLWVDRSGRAAEVIAEATDGDFEFPRISPDGDRIVVAAHGDSHDLWVFDIKRGTKTRLTTVEGVSRRPVWNPDGKRITYSFNSRLYSRAADASSPAELLLDSLHGRYPTSWSGTGEVLAFVEDNPETGSDIWLWTGDRGAWPWLNSRFDEQAGMFSPDGRWFAYVSNESGQDEVYVRPYPSAQLRSLVSSGGGREPMWSRDGQTLFYRQGDRLMAVGTSGGTFAPAPAREVFLARYIASAMALSYYDVAANGAFVMIGPPDDAGTELRVIVNWHDELKRRVPLH